MAVPKPQMVEIELYRGKGLKLKKTNGKLCAGILSFKEADPGYPVIWLGQKSYCITNLQNKKTVLFYDTLSKTLFRPSELASNDESVDMVTQSAQNVMLAGREAQLAMGIQDQTNTFSKVFIAALIILAVFSLVFFYLILTHQYTINAVTEVPKALSNATTTIPHTLGPNLVPQTT